MFTIKLRKCLWGAGAALGTMMFASGIVSLVAIGVTVLANWSTAGGSLNLTLQAMGIAWLGEMLFSFCSKRAELAADQEVWLTMRDAGPNSDSDSDIRLHLNGKAR